MKRVTPGYLLKQTILEKEAECREQAKLLRDLLFLKYESMKPVNILKRKFKEWVSVPVLKNNIFNIAIGVTTAHIANKILSGKSRHPITRLSVTILKMIIVNTVIKNKDEIKTIGSYLIDKLIYRKDNAEIPEELHSGPESKQ